ncbi:MAG: recombination-associated protein RdgC [Oligoflexales bacterium]
MGLIKGSISLCRYRLVGDNNFSLEKLNNKFRQYQSGLLGTGSDSSKEMRAGWVMPSGLTPDEERYGDYWDLSDCEVDEGYLLRIRIERKKIPSEFFQVMLRQKLDQINLERDKPLGKNARKIISDELKESLLAKALPTISYIDAYWRSDGLVTLFSTAKKNKEIFEDFFVKSFAKTIGSALVPLAPPLLGLTTSQWDLKDKTKSFLGKVEPLLPGAHLRAGDIPTIQQ